MLIQVDQIIPNPEQPRQTFDEEGLQSLAQSIKAQGVIQPIVVEISEDGQTYILHAGERRWRAAQIAGLETIPAVIVDPAPAEDRLTRALVENIQREDMSPLDVARAYARMHDELGMSDQQIADQVGKSRSSVANARRLLDLPDEAQDLASAGVPERALMALLPMYKLPEEIIKIGEDDDGHGGYPWNSPRALLNEIRKEGDNVTSDDVRRRVDQIIRAHTVNLERATWPLDHEFGAEDLKSSRCDKCPIRLKNDGDWHCPDSVCFEAKEICWRDQALQAASEASGIPILEGSSSYNTTERFYSDSDLYEQIIADGCENLRLQYDRYNPHRHVPDHSNAAILCYHGKGNHCICLSKLRAERTKNDPVHVAQRERKKELQRLVDEYSQALDRALAANHTGAWLQVLRAVAYNQAIKGDDWDLDCIRAKIAYHLMKHRVGWQAEQNIEYARRDFGEFFGGMGVPLPGRGDVAADIRRRFDRIQGWIDKITDGNEEPTLEAVQGNLTNLERITDEFDAISHEQLENEAFDGFLVDLARAWETLDTLKRELNGRQSVSAQTQELASE